MTEPVPDFGSVMVVSLPRNWLGPSIGKSRGLSCRFRVHGDLSLDKRSAAATAGTEIARSILRAIRIATQFEFKYYGANGRVWEFE
ncbi:protein of unknown function [Candidatus Filomicrobium marinum]|uniref:Uncharacterized protein n=1 Tax=Candidatus Filomicrobium marinum TaxID=1608628 RepID=A0A0D6JKG8_9HYPH|nr:protein of unknown function [Candidatus Filomicrobium marinum]CPR22155.1 protein of unknown function [Candidatus Filomicrobium marinum]